MPDQALLQIIKRTFEEISAKRNAAVLSLEGLRNTYRNTAANLRNAEARRDSAQQAETATRCELDELTKYCRPLVDKPQPFIQQMDTLTITLKGREVCTQQAKQIITQYQQELDAIQARIKDAEHDCEELNSEVKEVAAHLARLN